MKKRKRKGKKREVSPPATAKGEVLRGKKEMVDFRQFLTDRIKVRTQELQTVQDELMRQQPYVEVGRMVSVIFHEMRNSLHLVSTAARKIADRRIPDAVFEKQMEVLESGLRGATQLVDEVGSFVRAIPTTREEVDIVGCISDALAEVSVRETITVHKEFGQDLPPILADRPSLTGAIHRVVQNAVDAMAEGGDLHLVASENAGRVRIVVRDTGKGISPDIREKVFAPFFTTRAMGVGLGLAIAEKVVEAHGGEIRLDSEVGKGATLTISLPTPEGTAAEDRSLEEDIMARQNATDRALGSVFDYAEVPSEELVGLVSGVIVSISKHLDLDEISLGALHEGPTSSGEAGEVSEDGDIYLDWAKLSSYESDVAMAIIAHEIAHRVLGHHEIPGGLDAEREADDLAAKWGFNVAKFRHVCGSATHGEAPVQGKKTSCFRP